MLAVLSPAKNMRPAGTGLPLTPPLFEEKTRRLAEILKGYSAWELESRLAINPALAMKAFFMAQDFDPGKLWPPEGGEAGGWPALLAFYGLAYQSMAPEDFSEAEMLYAQDHLRILSAFYGLLRPLDRILPYRLEMQSKVKAEGQNLYRFWGDAPARALFAGGETVVNLASGEYAKALLAHLAPGDRLVTCRFEIVRRGRRMMLATEAKMARGRMARFLVKNRPEKPEDLREFEWDGYAFSPALSDARTYVFQKL